MWALAFNEISRDYRVLFAILKGPSCRSAEGRPLQSSHYTHRDIQLRRWKEAALDSRDVAPRIRHCDRCLTGSLATASRGFRRQFSQYLTFFSQIFIFAKLAESTGRTSVTKNEMLIGCSGRQKWDRPQPCGASHGGRRLQVVSKRMARASDRPGNSATSVTAPRQCRARRARRCATLLGSDAHR